MSEILEQLRTAADAFGASVDAVGGDQWTNATPCTEWDVRALVHHLAYELAWIPPLLEGKTIAEVGDSLEGDLLGDDPSGAYAGLKAAAVAAANAPGALEATTHLSFGDTPGSEYLKQIVFDLVVHGWDLKKGIGAEARIDPAVATLMLEWMGDALEGARKAGVFGAQVEVPADADAGSRLVAFTGRTP